MSLDHSLTGARLLSSLCHLRSRHVISGNPLGLLGVLGSLAQAGQVLHPGDLKPVRLEDNSLFPPLSLPVVVINWQLLHPLRPVCRKGRPPCNCLPQLRLRHLLLRRRHGPCHLPAGHHKPRPDLRSSLPLPSKLENSQTEARKMMPTAGFADAHMWTWLHSVVRRLQADTNFSSHPPCCLQCTSCSRGQQTGAWDQRASQGQGCRAEHFRGSWTSVYLRSGGCESVGNGMVCLG